MPRSQSELQVITRAKNLASYVYKITRKAPKEFRFSLIGRMHNYVLDIVQEMYFANDIFISPTRREGALMRQTKARSQPLTELTPCF